MNIAGLVWVSTIDLVRFTIDRVLPNQSGVGPGEDHLGAAVKCLLGCVHRVDGGGSKRYSYLRDWYPAFPFLGLMATASRLFSSKPSLRLDPSSRQQRLNWLTGRSSYKGQAVA